MALGRIISFVDSSEKLRHASKCVANTSKIMRRFDSKGMWISGINGIAEAFSVSAKQSPFQCWKAQAMEPRLSGKYSRIYPWKSDPINF